MTSDGRPWKAGGRIAVCRACNTIQAPVDGIWRLEAEEIYAGYEVYHQSCAEDQRTFDAGGGDLPRCAALLGRLSEGFHLKTSGRALDVGCGRGAMLRSIARLLGNWNLVGTEISADGAAGLTDIPGFEKLHIGPIEGLDGPFDLVTVVHVIEHIPDPVSTLRKLGALLGPESLMVLQTPDSTTNPFHLTIADHCTHFTADRLVGIAESAGLVVRAVADGWVSRELSVVAGLGGPSVPAPPSYPAREILQNHVAWLDQVRRSLPDGRVGVFGTSIAATWLAKECDDRVAFFVEEDAARRSRDLLGLPVLAPDDVEEGSMVYLALAPRQASEVADRLEHRVPAVHWIRPPTLEIRNRTVEEG